MSASAATTVLLPPILQEQFHQGVYEASALASVSTPADIYPQGTTVLSFSRNARSRIVEEGAPKPKIDGGIGTHLVKPNTFVYSQRVSKQFLNGAEEAKMEVLKSFMDAASASISLDFDWAVINGTQPGSYEDLPEALKAQSFKEVQAVVSDEATSGGVLLGVYDALSVLDSGVAPNATLISLRAKADAYRPNASGTPLLTPGSEVQLVGNTIVSSQFAPSSETFEEIGAVVGDFNDFRWGMTAPSLDAIPYGDPDGGGDLARYNQVLLRLELGIGWALINKGSFAAVKPEGA